MLLAMIDVDAFARDGLVKIEQAAPRTAADAARSLLWRQIGLSATEPRSWTEPVKWAADLTGDGPFEEITASPLLARALDQVCGPGGWVPRRALGNIPVRFPVQPPADDRGWHIDLNTPLDDGGWAVSGRPHTVLLLTLLSEVGPNDAPTRVRAGSHRDIAAALGPEPVDAFEFGPEIGHLTAGRPVTYATGSPGDMYLLHPFTAHAADTHRGTVPRFMAQAPVMLTEPLGPHCRSPLASAWR